jgi:hypothetical protein
MTLSIISIIVSLLFCLLLSCMIPLPKAVNPPYIPFNVVFCIGIGCCKKYSRCGVTSHDAPKSMTDCVISSVESFVAIKIDIFKSVLLCTFLLFVSTALPFAPCYS